MEFMVEFALVAYDCDISIVGRQHQSRIFVYSVCSGLKKRPNAGFFYSPAEPLFWSYICKADCSNPILSGCFLPTPGKGESKPLSPDNDRARSNY